jgi:hypothetical protein
MEKELCSNCGKEPSAGWPGRKGGTLCQECWEEQCNDTYWRYMEEWNRAWMLEYLAGIT